MKPCHVLFITLASFGLLTGCSNIFNSGDPEASFNQQMAAFENPAPPPDDQMPIDYDNYASYGQYQYNSNDRYDMYERDPGLAPVRTYAGNQNAYASSASTPRHHSLGGSGGGGVTEVPFAETRRKTAPTASTPLPNIGAL